MRGEWCYEADLKVPVPLQPLAPKLEGQSAFRAFHWSAQAAPEEGGTRLTLRLDHARKPVSFPLEQREEGVAAAKKDRALMRKLREDALMFKTVAP